MGFNNTLRRLIDRDARIEENNAANRRSSDEARESFQHEQEVLGGRILTGPSTADLARQGQAAEDAHRAEGDARAVESIEREQADAARRSEADRRADLGRGLPPNFADIANRSGR